jgi:hypothetical protein
MDIAYLIIEALKFIFPAYCANAMPVVTGGDVQWILEGIFWMANQFLGKIRLLEVSFPGCFLEQLLV